MEGGETWWKVDY
ncbi:hypothetical protein E2C01_095101 [Portunus trituberculatus]|uniref:Uncharacterized protein n=1 Tax=Portunus trituberculatus TaxID=210409 RepID=A0A5B7JZ43_PORTR|nr:hypothetical protein [Portunus trituberculatus]